MANTYDITELILERNQVRLLISDVTVTPGKFIFDDEEIDAFLSLEGSVVWAAARALEVIAANEVMVQKRITILDLKTDGPAQAKELREQAKEWRTTGGVIDDAGFAVAEVVYDDFTMRQRLINDLLRSGQ